MRLHMESWKRNQMEKSISVAIGQGLSPSGALQTKLKRLLDTDRNLDRKPRSKDPEVANYAFYSGTAPGRGGEVRFSSYEVFALFEAFHLMEHGLPQATAVSVLRRARPDLEPKHAEILRWKPVDLFDEQKIRKSARPGSLAVGSTRPVFLVIHSEKPALKDRSSKETTVAVLEQKELRELFKTLPGTWVTTVELTRTAHDLRGALAKTKPSKRGRGGS